MKKILFGLLSLASLSVFAETVPQCWGQPDRFFEGRYEVFLDKRVAGHAAEAKVKKLLVSDFLKLNAEPLEIGDDATAWDVSAVVPPNVRMTEQGFHNAVVKALEPVAALKGVQVTCSPIYHLDGGNGGSPKAAPAALLTCEGFTLLNNAGDTDQFKVTFVRSRFDEQPGIPAKVTVEHKVNTNTAHPNMTWLKLVDGASLRLPSGLEEGFQVDFKGGSVDVKVGNSGITGTRHALDGELSLEGRADAVHISCPLHE